MMRYKFITVEGNIGAGKTTLAHLLSRHFNTNLVLEAYADNPFLPKFYDDPQQHALPVELFFMTERFKQMKDLEDGNDFFTRPVISDYLFTKCLLFASVNLQGDEFLLYQRLFNMMQAQLAVPDVLIYLHAPVTQLQQNIKNRARPYEQKIPDSYLQQIEKAYDEYLKHPPVTTLYIDVANADFVEDKTQLNIIVDALSKGHEEGVHHLHLAM